MMASIFFMSSLCADSVGRWFFPRFNANALAAAQRNSDANAHKTTPTKLNGKWLQLLN
jgi:hypothetical protein